MKLLIKEIFFLILLEVVLSRAALYDDNDEDEEYIDSNNEITANTNDVMKILKSVLSKNLDEEGKTETKIIFQWLLFFGQQNCYAIINAIVKTISRVHFKNQSS
jgi:hypothetical protein